MTGRMPRVLVVHPGASWSTADVYDGLTYGLRSWGVEVLEYRLDGRLEHEHRSTAALYRRAKRLHKQVPKPTRLDTVYKASEGMVAMALKERVDAVIVMSAMFVHPAALVMLRRANTKVVLLCTESPYDLAEEVRIAELLTRPDEYPPGVPVAPISGVWTNERSAVSDFQAVNPRSGYLPHAWHPDRHTPQAQPIDAQVLAHDVVFVGTGTGFRERVEFFEAIDWSGIDLGLYGSWEGLRPRSPLRAHVRGAQVTNQMAAALYRRAKISLNFYRKSKGCGPGAARIDHAESLNPRAYELAACGAFHLSDPRAEVQEKFGWLVPTFTTAGEAEALIRQWLADDAGRAAVAARLPATVAEDSWVQRARQVIGDLRMLLQPTEAA